MNNAKQKWNPLNVSALVMACVCMFPTVVAVVGFILMVGLPLIGYAVLIEEKEVLGYLSFFGAIFYAAVAFFGVPTLAFIGAMLHPIGAASAVYARRQGAAKSGLLMLVAHIVMLGVDLIVFLLYAGGGLAAILS